MSAHVRTPLIAVAAALALTGALAPPASAAAPPTDRYTSTDLGVLGGLDSRAFALNDVGQVVGHADTSPGSGAGGFHAFRWTPTAPNATTGSMTDLGTLRGDLNSSAVAIDDAGLAVGTSMTSDSHAFIDDGTMHDLGTLPGGTSADASGINASGVVTGTAQTASGAHDAFVWLPRRPDGVQGRMYDLGTLPGDVASSGDGVNDAGTVVGSSLDADYLPHAFVWRPAVPDGATGTMTALAQPPGVQYSGALAVNDAGTIVGSMTLASGEIHAFGYDGTMHDLGTLPGGSESVAYDVASDGVAVGYSGIAARGQTHAALFADGRVLDLNHYLPGSAQAAGISLVVAYGINDHGQIAGLAVVGGHDHAFLLTPAG